MNRKIHILTPLLANQIAAGEVVERPASVVKELVENSLDAGSTRIQVDLENGGTKLIQVRDDGAGIVKEDLGLALSRHATSKIHELSDLHAIYSLGFRGEALASICSVSRLTLTSCVMSEAKAWSVTVEGAESSQTIMPASHPVGTTVTVRDLFFNTPARRKFLRTERTEYQQIEDLMRQFMLSRFDVGFVLRHQQRLIFNVRVAEDEVAQQQRVALVMGPEFIKDAKKLQKSCTDMTLHGWVGGDGSARSSTDRQFFYVNGRIVRDKLILHAVRCAYEGLLPEGRHAMYVLFLDLPPDKVDVNVHPTKHEVRFHESRQVHDFLVSALQESLQAVEKSKPVTHQECMAVPEVVRPTKQTSFHPMNQQRGYHPLPYLNAKQESASRFGHALGMLGSQYVLAATAEHLHVIQLTLAKRHISYHRLMSVLSGATIKAQPLLLPQTIDIPACDYAVLLAGIKRLQKLMIEIDTLGPSTIVVRKIPAMLQDCHLAACMMDVLQQQSMPNVIALLCQQIHHNGSALSRDDMHQLLVDLSPVNLKAQQSWFAMPVLTQAIQEFDHSFV